jgi:hypothetical protein
VDDVAQESGAAAELARHLKRGSTGRLTVGAPGHQVDVYTMNGQVVAAECTDDIRLLLRRIAATGALARERAAELGGQADVGDAVFGLLLEEVEEPVMERALFDRFRDNLARYLGSDEPAGFTPLGAVFVENFQLGHDTPALLRECAAMWRQSQRVPLGAVLTPHHAEDAAGDQAIVLRWVDGQRTVRQVLQELPVEPIYGRALIASMWANGILAPAAAPELAPAAPEVPAYEEGPTSQPKRVDEPREEGPRPRARADEELLETEVIEPADPSERLDLDDDLPDDVALEATDIVEMQVDAPEEPPPMGGNEDGWADFLAPDPDSDASAEAEDPADAEEVDDDPTLTGNPADVLERVEREKQRRAATAPPAAARPLGGNDVQSWLDPGVDLDDDILEAFADHDHVRGNGEDGLFSHEQLDRIDVTPPPEPPAAHEDEAIEVGEAPTAGYGARVLSDEQAHEKLAVTNECLGRIIEVFDRAEGPGRGLAAVQLLVDGSPSRFAALFHDLSLTRDGALPVDLLMRNLHHRPQTEHRQLLNQGLVDLIERGLSLVMDEITEDELIDEVLEATAGYRQRIGL